MAMPPPPPPPGITLPPGTTFHPQAVPGIPIANPPRPPAAGEVLLGYYYIQDTAGCFQCADLNFAGCCICTFFALWLVTWPLAMMVCLLPPFHTGMQFPVYGYPPPTADANAWQQGPPQQFQYPPTWTPPPPDPNMRPPQGFQSGNLPPSISSKNLNPPVAEGIPVGTAGGAGGTAPTTTEAPAAQKM